MSLEIVLGIVGSGSTSRNNQTCEPVDILIIVSVMLGRLPLAGGHQRVFVCYKGQCGSMNVIEAIGGA